MKKRIVAGLLGSVCALFAVSGTVQAMTYGYDKSNPGAENGSIIWYTETEADTERYSVSKDGCITEYGSADEIAGLSEEEKKKQEDWHRQEMREQIAYLETYGVTYDGEKDEILYQGKTVRWLIDRQIDNTCMAIQMPKGEIDLYTVRADDFTLTGVRIATEKEYEERTKEEEKTRLGASGMQATTTESAEEAAVTQGTDVETYAAQEQDVEQVEDMCEETATEDGSITTEDLENNKQKIEEYEQAGIGYDAQTGYWLWQGQPIYILADENGSLYQNGSDEAKKNKIYVIVKRNDDGSIKEAKKVTLEDAVKEKIKMDTE